MTVVHAYFYIVVDTQQGCRNLKKLKKSVYSGFQKVVMINETYVHVTKYWHGWLLKSTFILFHLI